MTDPLAPTDGVQRDGWKRPLIAPLVDGRPDMDRRPVAYTRASTFAKATAGDGGLSTWKTRHAVVGVAISPDLAAMAGALGLNPDDYTNAQKQELDEIIETAHDRSSGNAKANYGTAVHTLTMPDSQGVAAAIPDMAGDVAAYDAALDRHGIEVVDSEIFVVHDGLKVAGTYDHRYRLTRDMPIDDASFLPAGTLLLGDKKTGKLNWASHAIQLAVYARAEQYDPATGERADLGVSQLWGLLAHIGRGTATCDLYLVNLSVGWRGAELCDAVRSYNSTKLTKARPFPVVEASTVIREPADDVTAAEAASNLAAGMAEVAAATPNAPECIADPFDDAVERITEAFDATPTDDTLEAIRICKTHAELKNVWSRYKATWTETHTAASKARMEQIGAGN